jgi:hypothetical protein
VQQHPGVWFQDPGAGSLGRRGLDGHLRLKAARKLDWSEAFEVVPSLRIAYVWHASIFTREVLNGLLRIGFEHHQQII